MTKLISLIQNSNHPSSVIHQIPLSIDPRLSTLPYYTEKIFHQHYPPDQKVLQNSDYKYTVTHKRPNNDNSSTI